MKKLLALLLIFTLLLSGCALLTGGHSKWQEQYDLGIRYLNEGNYQEAILAFEAAIKIDPKQADAYVALADAYLATEDYDNAMAALTRGMDQADSTSAIQGKYEQVRQILWDRDYELALYYISNGELQEAVVLLDAIIILDGRIADGYITLAETYVDLGDRTMAVETLKEGYEYADDVVVIEQMLRDMDEGAWLETAQRKQWEASDESEEATPIENTAQFQQEEDLPPIDFDAADFTYTGTCGDNLQWGLNTATGALVITGTGDMYDFERVNYLATSAPWGEYADAVRSVQIDTGVNNIGAYAFFYCSSMTSAIVPGNVSTIGRGAFQNCEKLTSVKLLDGVSDIMGAAFYDCVALTSLTLPASVAYIGNYAFDGCSSLTDVKVHEANNTYCDQDGIIYTKDMQTLVLYPEGRTAEHFDIPDGVLTIGVGAVKCPHLTSVNIPSSVTLLDECAFAACSGLTTVTIPENVYLIGETAFSGCTGLTSIDIPVSLISVHTFAFANCDNLTDVYYAGTKKQWKDIFISYDGFITSCIAVR